MKVAAALPLLFAGASAFAPAPASKAAFSTSLSAGDPLYAEVGGQKWDPLGLYGLEDAADTFPNMFPKGQYLEESEIKHGRMAMLAWTGVWATHVGGLGMGMHIPGFPVEPDWTKALGVFAAEQPAWFFGILAFIGICEGESVGHSGDNFRGMGTKTPGDLGFDPWGLKAKLSEEQQAKYKTVELKNGRAAMIAMASLFAFESIPGSVPIMDVLGAQ